ncbi:MAG: GAF and ANTAR domain-containing protein [Acidimicrobiales bacterium]
MASTEQGTSTIEDSAIASAIAFTEVARSLFLSDSVEDSLTRAVDLSVLTIEACEFAGAFLLEGEEVTTRACTDPIVVEIDGLQLRAGEGPCLDAIAHKLTFYADELGTDPRWPSFGPEAAAMGIRSLLALPMATDGTLGALNLYARYPQAFGVIDRARGLLLASMAGFACSIARAHEDEERRAENLHAALVTRELIGQAQGILIERERISADQAFHVLRQASQHLNVKLREVAQDLIETGERPDTGSPRSA